MKAADGNSDSRCAKRLRDVERARKLVRLNSDQRDKSEAAVATKAFDQPGNVDPGIRLIHDLDVDRDIRPEHLPLRAIGRDPIHGGERVRGAHRPPPPNEVTVVVVMGWLDEDKEKPTSGSHADAGTAQGSGRSQSTHQLGLAAAL